MLRALLQRWIFIYLFIKIVFKLFLLGLKLGNLNLHIGKNLP